MSPGRGRGEANYNAVQQQLRRSMSGGRRERRRAAKPGYDSVRKSYTIVKYYTSDKQINIDKIASLSIE